MADFKLIPIDQIVVPERLRSVDEEVALAIAQSVVEHGLFNPITVRATPAAKGGKWTLIAGAHRLRAYELNGEPEIETIVVEADKAEAQLIEITENLFRNELSVIDKAVFVQTYRDVWESKYGKIEAGRPGNRINLIQLIETEVAAGSFSEHIAERMGVSTASIKRLQQIAQINPVLRSKLRGTSTADNQSLLLKLAKEGPKRQAQIAAALDKEPDLKKVLELAKEPAAEVSDVDKQRAIRANLDKTWKSADRMTQVLFVWDKLIDAGVDQKLLQQVRAEMEKGSR